MQKISEAIVAGSLEAIGNKEASKLAAELKAQETENRRVLIEEHGGRVVAAYTPNRRQRRAQQAKLRSKK